MGGWGWVWRRLEVLLRKDRAEAELDDELRFHLEMEIREHVRAGVPPVEARRRALVAFGGVERFKEEVRDVRGARMVDDLVQDLRVAARSLVKAPVFTGAVLLTLALGIGGNVAMFAVLDASLFASLPYPDADRLVTGRSTFDDGARLGPFLSGFDLLDYRQKARGVERVGGLAPFPQRATIAGVGETERADVVFVVPGFFDALGVAPVVGRAFLPEEGEPGATDVVVLSHGYWTTRFGGDAATVGRTLVVNGTPRTIVGVMPPEGRFMVDADVWVPAVRGEGMAGSRRTHNFLMVARLAPGTSLADAQSDLDRISAQLAEAYPESNRGKGIVLTPAREMLSEAYRGTLTLLVGAVALLLVVACANAAGLLLARGNARAAEMSVRSVMGAGRGRLVRQLVTESALLAGGAGALGLLLAAWVQRGVLAFVSMDRLGTLTASISPGTAIYALLLSLATVVLFGVLPAFRVARTDTSTALRGSGKVAGSRDASRLRSSLVVAQVAVTVVLLSVSGLLARSLQELRQVDPGFSAGGLLTAEVELPSSEYSLDARIAFYEELHGRLAALPGVSDVALASQLPLRDPGNNWGLGLPGALDAPDGVSFLAHQRVAFPGYFSSMGIPLLAGRDVSPDDQGVTPPALVLSESAAMRLFGTEPAPGRLVAVQGSEGEVPHEVVGVVGDVALDGVAFGTPPAMYYAYHDRAPARMRLAVRIDGAGGEAASAGAAVRDVLRALDAGVPLDGVQTMASVMDRGAADARALAVLVTMFAAMALVLACVGLYGVLAYQVTRRIREIGIRMALGATVTSVSGSVVRGGLTLVAVGLALGIPASLLAGRFIQGFLFGVGSADPLTYVLVAGSLGVVASMACLLPARRAAAVDPARAFRLE